MLDVCSAILIRGSDLLKHWRVTHILNACSVFVINFDLPKPKHWSVTHMLDACSAIHISGFDLLQNH